MYSIQDSNSITNGGRTTNMEAAATATAWSKPDNKIFEDALLQFPEEVPNRWQKIADCLDGKTQYDVIVHYDALLRDVQDIEADLIQLPAYSELSETGQTSIGAGGSQSGARKKGKPWTEEEHMLFLIGLEKYGRSDWRSISRNVVKTRRPSQVASHAQKYFNRQLDKKKRKRSSIHDVNSVTDLGKLHLHSSDPDSPYTPRNDDSPLPYQLYPSTNQSPYTPNPINVVMANNPYFATEQSPHTPISVGMSSNLYPPTVQSPYTLPNVMSVGMASNLYPSTEQSPYTPSNPYLLMEQSSYTTPSKMYPATPNTYTSSEQSPHTPINVGMSSNLYPPTVQSPYTLPNVMSVGMASNLYPSREQSPYTPSNPYLLMEQPSYTTPSKMYPATPNTYTSSEQSPSSTDSLPFGDINNMDADELLALPKTDFVVLVRPGPDIGESYPP